MIAINAQMPKNCIDCPFGRILDCPTYPKFGQWYERVTLDITDRPDNCPLRPVEVLKAAQMFSDEEEQRFGKDVLERMALDGISEKMAKHLRDSGRMKINKWSCESMGNLCTVIEGRLYTVGM